jgi:hypothetical protein
MPVPIQGEVYPQPRPSALAAAAWRELGNRILAESSQADAALSRARSGGADVVNQTSGIKSDGDKIADALHGAKPGPENAKLAGALANSAGVGSELSRAVGKSNDPNTDPGQIDFEAANRAAGFGADGISSLAANLRGWPDPGPGSDDRRV